MTFRFASSRPCAVFDTECFPNYWCIGFRSFDGTKRRVFELYDGHPLDKKSIARIFRNWRVYGFNSTNYDIPMVVYAMSGATNKELKKANDELIVYGVTWWQFLQRMELEVPEFIDHVDLQQVSPGAPQMPSLKMYGGRLHSRRIQELPLHHDTEIDALQRTIILPYNDNDLDTTYDLAAELADQIDLRAKMSVEYGVDLRSKSDAQIAEAVIKVELERALGRKLYAPDIEPGSFRYKVPPWCRFETDQMKGALATVADAKFAVNSAGQLLAPESVKSLSVTIGEMTYSMGLGGLHSTESCVSHWSDETYVLKDRDVTSYYPMSILLQGMYPKHLGQNFLNVYRRIFERRIAAKKAGDKNTAETLKIVLNGTFGKLGSPYSIMFSPDLMLQVTLSGQLAILMLIERLTLAGVTVVSGNTDGIVSKVRRTDVETFEEVIAQWEKDTGYATEEVEYESLHSRDVNNYIAIKREKGERKAKLKGAYAASGPGLPGAAGLKKNPDMDISTDAVVAYLIKGTPIEETIEWATDFRKFMVVRRVNGGAVDSEGNKIGSALRWYYSTEAAGQGFTYANSGNSVPRSTGAKLQMTIKKVVPPDCDDEAYIREAYAILEDIGCRPDDPALRGRTGTMYARLPDAKTVHLVRLPSGVAWCGKARSTLRDKWVEYKEIPAGHKVCKKCVQAKDEL